MRKLKLSKSQRQFYAKIHSDLLKAVRVAFKELNEACDSEGVYFLSIVLQEIARKAKTRVRRIEKSL